MLFTPAFSYSPLESVPFAFSNVGKNLTIVAKVKNLVSFGSFPYHAAPGTRLSEVDLSGNRLTGAGVGALVAFLGPASVQRPGLLNRGELGDKVGVRG